MQRQMLESTYPKSEEIKMSEQCKTSTQHHESVQHPKLVCTIAAVLSTVAFFPVDAIFVVAPVTTPVDTSFRDLSTAPLHASPSAIPNKAPWPLHDTLVAEGAQGLGLLPQALNSCVLGLVIMGICSTVVLPFGILAAAALVALYGQYMVEAG